MNPRGAKARSQMSEPVTMARDAVPRAEWKIVALIVVIGIALRCAFPMRLSVEHFDEGVYASNLVAGEMNQYRYPFQHLYAPPFFPSLLEWSMVFLGQTSFAAMLASLTVGALTPLLVWHVGRRWFGPAAGLSAAVLAALSDFHLIYSRAALTDALLCFWFLLAVYLTWEASRRGQLLWGVAAGAATALAWWTKYTGWLPLAVGASGLIPWLLFHRRPERSPGKVVMQWVVIAVTAALLWSPWWQALREYGGYEVVADNHSRYVHLDRWMSQLIQQATNHRFLSGWLSCGSLLLAALAAGLTGRVSGGDSTWNRSGQNEGLTSGWISWLALPIAVGGLLAAGALCLGSSSILAIGAVIGMAVWILPHLGSRAPDERHPHASLAAWLVAAWFFGTFVSTPAYHPYPRLTLPWLIAAWMGTGALFGWIIERSGATSRATDAGSSTPRRQAPAVLLLGGAAISLVICGAWFGKEVTARGVPGWQNRTDLEQASLQVIERAREFVRDDLQTNPQTLLMYVYGEPGIFFHVGRSEGVVAAPVVELKFAAPGAERPSVPVFLVAGPPASTSETFAEQWKQFGSAFREVGRFEYQPSDLVLLDNLDGGTLSKMAERPREEIRLYSLK